LVHGVEAVLPVEITHEAPKISSYDEITSTEALQDDVDALDEGKDVVLSRTTQYQQIYEIIIVIEYIPDLSRKET
jgi:hypothetical protein